MARTNFTTTIEETLQNEFKSAIALNGSKMNDILELFMKGYINGDFKVAMLFLEEKYKENTK